MEKVITEQFLIDTYGRDATVVSGEVELTLGEALDFEAIACPADVIKRQDPIARARHIAGMLFNGGSLRPEHECIIEAASKE